MARSIWAVPASGGGERLLARTPGELTIQDIARDGRTLMTSDNGMVGIIGGRPAEEGERDLSLLDWSLLRDISPDGKLILFDESGEGGGAVHAVYVRRTDGSPAVRLGEGVGGSLSPDGRWAVSRKAGGRQLILLPVRAGQARALEPHALTYHTARFVPDGKSILTAASEADDAVRLWIYPIDGGKPHPVTDAGVEIGPFPVSPDGRHVVVQTSDFAWHLLPLGGGPPQPVSGLGPDDRPVAFTPDGCALYGFRRGELPGRLFRLDLASGGREVKHELRPRDPSGVVEIVSVVATPDGSELRVLAATDPVRPVPRRRPALGDAMKIRRLIASALFLAAAAVAPAASIPTPSEFLGMSVGADKTIADYRQILAYFKALDAASPRVEVQVLGKTTLGEDMFMAAISSEENIANKQRLQEIARKIADPRGLSEAESEALVREGKVFLFITCNIHSTEIGASQMAMEWAHALATAEDAETKRRLDEVVLLLLPSLNPDGQIMETEWYRKNLGTRYEGGRMPWLYHHYVGHDNNRDWFMLTQKETQAVTRAVYHEWFPQVWLDEHQMGSTGPRIFMPPYAEPVDPDIHPLVWRDVNLIGANMALRLEQEGKSGVIYGYVFDAYWPGGTKNTAWWKNISGLLTEVASAALRDARAHRAERALGRRQGPRRVRAADQLPEPLARRQVAAARHHGLRAHRLRRDPRDLRRAPRRLSAQRAHAGARRDRELRRAATLSASRPPSATPRAPHGSRRCSPSTASSCARRRTATSTSRSRSRTAVS